jgi:hypothetical protein
LLASQPGVVLEEQCVMLPPNSVAVLKRIRGY